MCGRSPSAPQINFFISCLIGHVGDNKLKHFFGCFHALYPVALCDALWRVVGIARIFIGVVKRAVRMNSSAGTQMQRI